MPQTMFLLKMPVGSITLSDYERLADTGVQRTLLLILIGLVSLDTVFRSGVSHRSESSNV